MYRRRCPLSREPILIVDDNLANSRLVEVLLAAEGYDVRVAQNAEEALSLLTSFTPSLILMDLQLPGMDGLALTRLLKSDPATGAISVVAVTACAMLEDERRALAAGCDGYITKPINTRTFPREIAAFLHPEGLPS